MKKQLKLWLIVAGLIFLVLPAKVWAGQLKLALSNPPSDTNKNDFRVYYTYLETENKTATVDLFIKKEGKTDWRQVEDENKTEVSGYFQLKSSDIYEGEGIYDFYAQAATSDQTIKSQTVTTNFDTSAPASPSDYGKERINSTTFRLNWKNPNDSDFFRVYIYRSESSAFNADEGTKVGEMGGGREEKMTFSDGSVQEGKDYYYMIRAVDQAGNGSSLVGDTSESSGDPGSSQVAPEGQAVGAEETVSGQEYSVSQSQGQILGEEEAGEEEDGTPSSETEEGEGAEEKEGEKTQSRSFWWWLLPGGAIVLFGAKQFLKKEDK